MKILRANLIYEGALLKQTPALNITTSGVVSYSLELGTWNGSSLNKPSFVNEGVVLRAVLTTTLIADGTTIGYTISGVTSGDISVSTTGNFIVSGNRAFIDIPITNDSITDGDKTLKIALTGTPTVFSTMAIIDSSREPEYSITASHNSINEGESLIFYLNTTGVASGTVVPWAISGNVDYSDLTPNGMNGNFTVGSDGKASLAILLNADLKTEGNEVITMTLTGKNKSVSVNINDTSKLEQREATYYFPDTYYVVVKPNETIEVELLGGSGCGGGLFRNDYNPEDVSTVLNATGRPSMLFNFDTIAMAIGEGGARGQSGIWTNTGALTNGNGGSGGTTSIQSSVLEGEITLITRATGQSGKQTLADHTGGLAAVLTDRQGGEGMSYAIQTNPPLYGFGGGGGGGGYVKFKYKNTSPDSTRTLTLIVGKGGDGWVLGSPPQQRQSGSGSNGFASVYWNRP